MNKHEESWDACPPGELRRMVAGIHDSRRRETLHRASSVLAVVLLIAAGAWLSVQLVGLARRGGDGDYGALACREVQSLLGEYGHGVLAAALEEKIAVHLQRCEHCHELYQNVQKTRSGKQASRRGAGARLDRRLAIITRR